MTDQFGIVWGYVVPCAGCDIKMVVPDPMTDVCPRCSTFSDDDYPVSAVIG